MVPGEADERLAASVLGAEGPAALSHWHSTLHVLAQAGLLVVSARTGGELLASLIPIAPSFVLAFGEPDLTRAYVASRFAYARVREGSVILESPLSFARIVLHDSRGIGLFYATARPGRAAEVVRRVSGLSEQAALILLALLHEAGMIGEVSSDGTTADDRNTWLRTWEFHDLLFHARSRLGRHDSAAGATYQHRGISPPPALRPSVFRETIALERPDLSALMQQSASLAAVQEARRSVRTYGAQPITARQLGEFLHRVARVKEQHSVEMATPDGPLRMEVTTRPYPSGGALHELEVYPVVNACEGLAPGLYRYDPLEHRLEVVAGVTPEVEELLVDASSAVGMAAKDVQILLIVAARFQRVSWKYSTFAYAMTLKHVGVLLQTMYLTAADMGLAPCALGAGNADVFSRVAGTDYTEESSVGEFLLGSGNPVGLSLPTTQNP